MTHSDDGRMSTQPIVRRVLDGGNDVFLFLEVDEFFGTELHAEFSFLISCLWERLG